MLFDVGGAFSGLGAVILALFVVVLLMYIFYAYCLYRIAKKLNTKLAWLSFVPFVNFIYPFYMAKFPWWLIVICVISMFTPDQVKIFYLIYVVGFIYAWSRIAQQLRRPSWWGVVMIISPVNLILMGLLAFKDTPQTEPAQTSII